ncbi:hypothetical protein K1X12_10715 [Hyphomonas sp. WL0036]|uniref:hypothetical protein n=1 Tax=Hyphomonas sediminis TaxID=2866160 RepID=UPI001C7E7DAD|nr:hypothetical protein [Hyphomonas sediminis]MBY9067374.1 hypothetical protein [Hyphomonas sediminis]
MAFQRAAAGRQTGQAMRLAALLMLFLALSLAVWRASSLLTGSQPDPRSPAEASLLNLIEPIAGAGNARVTIARNPEGGRTLLLLLDARAATAAGDLQRILPDAAGLDFKRGDKLVIEQAAFARGLPGRPDTAAWLELSALGLISLISAGMALSTLRPAGSVAAPAPAREPEREMRVEPLRPLRPIAPVSVPDASEAARRDPAKAAAVLRGWMRNDGDAS